MASPNFSELSEEVQLLQVHCLGEQTQLIVLPAQAQISLQDSINPLGVLDSPTLSHLELTFLSGNQALVLHKANSKRIIYSDLQSNLSNKLIKMMVSLISVEAQERNADS
jgi:hypothetical protein